MAPDRSDVRAAARPSTLREARARRVAHSTDPHMRIGLLLGVRVEADSVPCGSLRDRNARRQTGRSRRWRRGASGLLWRRCLRRRCLRDRRLRRRLRLGLGRPAAPAACGEHHREGEEHRRREHRAGERRGVVAGCAGENPEAGHGGLEGGGWHAADAAPRESKSGMASAERSMCRG
jgi:hypothetical protein